MEYLTLAHRGIASHARVYHAWSGEFESDSLDGNLLRDVYDTLRDAMRNDNVRPAVIALLSSMLSQQTVLIGRVFKLDSDMRPDYAYISDAGVREMASALYVE